MECQVCYNEVQGGMIECEVKVTLDMIALYREPTADCNWIECDGCGLVVCFHCCRYPESNFCDQCIARYNLTAELIELGLMTEGI